MYNTLHSTHELENAKSASIPNTFKLSMFY